MFQGEDRHRHRHRHTHTHACAKSHAHKRRSGHYLPRNTLIAFTSPVIKFSIRSWLACRSYVQPDLCFCQQLPKFKDEFKVSLQVQATRGAVWCMGRAAVDDPVLIDLGGQRDVMGISEQPSFLVHDASRLVAAMSGLMSLGMYDSLMLKLWSLSPIG
jgi:hypothetical protein